MKKLSILICFVLLSVTLQAQERDATSVAQDIVARFNAVQTLASNFVQEKHMTLLSEPVISRGKFAFSKEPAQIRWEYTEPFQNGFLLSGGKTFRLEKGIKTPVKNTLARNIASQMMMWLTFDLEQLSKTYEINYFEGGVVLTPKEKITALEKITAWFSPENPQALEKIRLEEPGGDFTQLVFENPQINQPLAKDTFQ